jgi:aldose 1-epimerase
METIVIRDSASGSFARIAPQFGFNCYEFEAAVGDRTVSVIDSSPDFPQTGDRPSGHGIPLLFPFPNRIRAGRFTWDGKDYHLPPSLVAYNKDNAIHGFCLDRPWRVVDQSEDCVTGEFQLSKDAPDRLALWPADFVIRVEYILHESALQCLVLIENPSDEPLPWGFGTHPYFRLPLAPESVPQQCLLEVPAAEEWELEDCLPTGKRRPVPYEKDFIDGAYYGLTRLDDVLTGLPEGADGCATVIYDEPAGLQVTQWFDAAFREVVLYTPPNRNAVCIEPYTCVTDAINLQQWGINAGLQVLEPGGEVHLAIDIEAGEILV